MESPFKRRILLNILDEDDQEEAISIGDEKEREDFIYKKAGFIILGLPIELIYLLLTKYLDADDIINLCEVNKEFKEFCQVNNLDKYAKYDKKALRFGQNSQFGQLGNGSLSNIYLPKPIHYIKNVKKVVAGRKNVGLITQDRELYMAGSNSHGQLNIENVKQALFFIKMDINSVLDVGIGLDHVVCVTTDSSVYGWGSNYIEYDFPVNEKIVQVKCSYSTTFILTESGKLYSSGDGTFGELGIGIERDLGWNRVMIKNPIIDFDCGYTHIGAITKYNKLFMWGHGDRGALGDGNSEYNHIQRTPLLISKDIKFQKISCGHDSTAAIDINNSLYVWGDIVWGKLGVNTDKNILTPFKTRIKAKQVSCGSVNTMIIDLDDRLYIAGGGAYGALGDNDPSYHYISSFTLLFADNDVNIDQIECGNEFSFFITSLKTPIFFKPVKNQYLCNVCFKNIANWVCGNCKKVTYCSKACQFKNIQHNKRCK